MTVHASRPFAVIAAFALGACTAAAVQSSASTPTATTPAAATPTPPTPTAPVAATVIRAADTERRLAPNSSATVTVLARGNNAFVARLEMEPGAAVPEHRDATEEYIHVLEGSGTIVIDGQSYPVETGSTVFMPAEAQVSFENGNRRLVGIQVFAGPEPAAKYDAWTPIE